VEFCDVYEMQDDFAKKVEAQFNQMIEAAASAPGNKEH
jgi:type III restriction enzyme